nr:MULTISPECIES: M24 family metallopeptidase [Streptomyces]
MEDFGGHGIGRRVHEDPGVPNEGRPGRGMPLRHGMVFAIEPMPIAGGTGTYHTAPDGRPLRTDDGTRAAHVEHTVAVTAAGPRLLTARRQPHPATAAPRPHGQPRTPFPRAGRASPGALKAWEAPPGRRGSPRSWGRVGAGGTPSGGGAPRTPGRASHPRPPPPAPRAGHARPHGSCHRGHERAPTGLPGPGTSTQRRNG